MANGEKFAPRLQSALNKQVWLPPDRLAGALIFLKIVRTEPRITEQRLYSQVPPVAGGAASASESTDSQAAAAREVPRFTSKHQGPLLYSTGSITSLIPTIIHYQEVI